MKVRIAPTGQVVRAKSGRKASVPAGHPLVPVRKVVRRGPESAGAHLVERAKNGSADRQARAMNVLQEVRIVPVKAGLRTGPPDPEPVAANAPATGRIAKAGKKARAVSDHVARARVEDQSDRPRPRHAPSVKNARTVPLPNALENARRKPFVMVSARVHHGRSVAFGSATPAPNAT